MSKYIEIHLVAKIEIVTCERVDEQQWKQAFIREMTYGDIRSWGNQTMVVGCGELAQRASLSSVDSNDYHNTFVKGIEIHKITGGDDY